MLDWIDAREPSAAEPVLARLGPDERSPFLHDPLRRGPDETPLRRWHFHADALIGTAVLASAALTAAHGLWWLAGGQALLATTALSSAILFRRRHRLDAERRMGAQRGAVAHAEAMADRMWELRESEERFRGLVDALGDIVVHRDADGRIVSANRVLAGLLGTPAAELQGRTLAELGIEIGVVPDAAVSDGECLSSTDVAIRTQAGTRWFSWIELSVRDEATGAISHRAIARDITDRKRAELALVRARERAEHASKAKSRFLATVSHEIRTPMNGIVGMAKLLAGTRLSPEQKTYVGAVSTSAGALLALIEDLLDFSKIEAGRLEIEPQPISPRELVEHAVELMAARAFGKNIGLGCHIAPDVPLRAELDPNRLRQVLLNLIGNAVKFTEVGGVLVNVAVEESDGRRELAISVADTGPGLDPADLTRIFGEFEQADVGRTRKHGGAGLGLAISRRIVEAMHGTIQVDTRPGNGATFTIRLPLLAAGNSPLISVGALAGQSVLVLSQNAMEAEALSRTVRSHDGTAIVARTVDEALLIAGDGRGGLSALIVDAALESGDATLLRALRGHGFGGKAVTLIAPGDRAKLQELRAAGYAAFLPRPARAETMLRVLLNAGEQVQPQPVPERAGRRRRTGRPERPGLSVLIAEDNEINAVLARAALTKAGHNVHIVGNGKAAVDALGDPAQRFDVVLMDLHMPTMDGLEAIGRIRRNEAERGLPPVPVLVLSADGQEETHQVVVGHGASGFLTKPVDPAALVLAVEGQVH